jgi:hypothetical protein
MSGGASFAFDAAPEADGIAAGDDLVVDGVFTEA